MATTLKKTNVVMIGAGAAGGVAALPIAQAGIEVIALEAGSWVRTRDMAPDELRYLRGWPSGIQKVNGEIPTHRPNASAAYTPRAPIHPMMNAVGGTSILGAKLAAESMGLQSRQCDQTALRRFTHPEGLDCRGLAVRFGGTRTVL